jgi:hypothetical protein
MISNTLLAITFTRRKGHSARNRSLQLGCLSLVGIGILAETQNASAQYLGRDLVVSQIGTGSGTLSSAGTAVILNDYNTSGTLQKTVPLPTTNSGANYGIVSSGTATSEGALTLSSDGQYLVYSGYNSPVGTASVASSTSARVIARIDANGNVDTTTALTDAYSGNNIRSVATPDGVTFYTGGTGTSSSGGVRITTLGSSTSTLLSTTVTNIRDVNIAMGQLYASSASGSNIGVNAVGTGLPTTAGQTITLLPGFSGTASLSPYDYVVASSSVIYVADDGASLSANRGLQKWVLVGGTWTLAYKITTGLPGTDGLRGLTASIDNGIATLYAITTETSANDLVSFTDPLTAGSNSGSFTILDTAAANTVFRGVDFAPKSLTAPAATPEPGGIVAAVIAGGLIAARRRRKTRLK